MSHYPAMFAAFRKRGEGVLVPFVMVGDPGPDTSEAVIEALIAGGAGAPELGVPFTDPVADGLTIQKAHVRTLATNVGFQGCLEVIRWAHQRHPWLPIGMLICGDVPSAMGLGRFYSECARADIDSVLLSDAPTCESAIFSRIVEEADADATYIVLPSTAARTLDIVTAASRGYVHAVSRVGVTGTERASPTVEPAESVERLRADAAASVMLDFDISTPERVVEAIAAGADGVISGSATVKIVERYAPEIMAAASSNNGVGGSEERRHYALGALRSDLATFTAMTKEVTRPH